MLDILYQDQWIVAVDKPAGQLVHPSDTPQPDDEVTMKILRDQLGQKVEVIHRLDRPTTGVLVFGLCVKASKVLRRSFEEQKVQKTYLAFVNGVPALANWQCDEPLQKNEDSPIKSASTDFQILKRFGDDYALIEARPKTGRFHQIRRHLLQADHPIVGDYRYAGIESCEQTSKKLEIGTRMLLQASAIEFIHPVTKKALKITGPLDPIITTAMNQLS